MKEKLFIASYSGGKDSALALYRAVKMRYTPGALLTSYNTDKNRSWFHGVPKEVLESVADSVGCPLWLMETGGEEYTENFEKCLIKAKEQGIDYCVFGDIDIEEHRKWCTERCENTGLTALFPLWNESRKSLVEEFINSGFTANITIIDTKRMSDRHLGKPLTIDLISELESEGVDVCGENGEYHTFVSAGALFKKPIIYSFGEKLLDNNYAILPIKN